MATYPSKGLDSHACPLAGVSLSPIKKNAARSPATPRQQQHVRVSTQHAAPRFGSSLTSFSAPLRAAELAGSVAVETGTGRPETSTASVTPFLCPGAGKRRRSTHVAIADGIARRGPCGGCGRARLLPRRRGWLPFCVGGISLRRRGRRVVDSGIGRL